MIRGSFLSDPVNVPVVSLMLKWGDVAVCPVLLLDSGFSGDLKVSSDTASELGLIPEGMQEISIADGSKIEVPVATGYALLEGEILSMSILVGDGAPLVGIGLLTKFGYKASMDCKNRTVELEKM